MFLEPYAQTIPIATIDPFYSWGGTMSEFSTIQYEISDSVARITLDRVETRNAQNKKCDPAKDTPIFREGSREIKNIKHC